MNPSTGIGGGFQLGGMLLPQNERKRSGDVVRPSWPLIQEQIKVICMTSPNVRDVVSETEWYDPLNKGVSPSFQKNAAQLREIVSLFELFEDTVSVGQKSTLMALVSNLKQCASELETQPKGSPHPFGALALKGPERADRILKLFSQFPTWGSDASSGRWSPAFQVAGELRNVQRRELLQLVREAINDGDVDALRPVFRFIKDVDFIMDLITEPAKRNPSADELIDGYETILGFLDDERTLFSRLLAAPMQPRLDYILRLLAPYLDGVEQSRFAYLKDLEFIAPDSLDRLKPWSKITHLSEIDTRKELTSVALSLIENDEIPELVEPLFVLHALFKLAERNCIKEQAGAGSSIGLPKSQVEMVLEDLASDSFNRLKVARNMLLNYPDLRREVWRQSSSNTVLWSGLNRSMDDYIESASVSLGVSFKLDIVGALFRHLPVGDALHQSVQSMSDASLKLLLNYLKKMNEFGKLVTVMCTGSIATESRSWRMATQELRLVDPSDPEFVINATDVALAQSRDRRVRQDPALILQFVNPELGMFWTRLGDTAAHFTTMGTDVERAENVTQLAHQLRAIKYWHSGVLQVPLSGQMVTGTQFMLRLTEMIPNKSLALPLRQAATQVLVALLERPSATIVVNTSFNRDDFNAFSHLGYRATVVDGIYRVTVSPSTSLIEQLIRSGQSVQQIVNSGMPILEREPLGLCTTVAPMPFLAAVLLDRDAVRDLLRVFPMSIRQVGTNQMTMAQMAVKGIKDEGASNLERIEAFKSTLGLILDFATVSGVDLTAPIQGNSVDGTGTSPWGVGVFIDAWLPTLIDTFHMREIRKVMDRSRDIEGARQRLAEVMPEFLGRVKQSIEEGGIQGVYTADVDPETQAAVVRPLRETDDLNNRWLYRPADALMDLPMATSIRYHTHLAEVARVMDLVMARHPDGIATMSRWVDEYAERLPIAPGFNTFYRVNAVMLNSAFVAHLDNESLDGIRQGLANRLHSLRRVVMGTSLLDGLGYSSIEVASPVEREVSVGSVHDAFIVANVPITVIDRENVAAAVSRLSSVPASVFETAAAPELAALSFDWQGAVVVPCGEPINGKLVVAVRNVGHGKIYARDERSRFELKLDSEDTVGVYNEIRQLVVFPPGTSYVHIGKVLRLAESTSIENGHEVSGVLGISASVVDIQSAISRRNGIHCDVSVAPFGENSYRIAEDWRVIISDEVSLGETPAARIQGLIARNLGGREDTSIGIFNERLDTLLADCDGLLQLRLRDNLVTLGILEPQDRARLYPELVDALLGDNDRRCEAAVSLLSMVSCQSILMINRATRVTRATVVGRVADGISVIVVGNCLTKVGQLGKIEMGDDAVSTTESETHSMPDSELVDVGGDLNDSGLVPLDLTSVLVGLEVPTAGNRSVDHDGAAVRSPSPQIPLNRIGTVLNTCWLETIVNIEALQLNDALRLGGAQFPPITRMILDGLSTVPPSDVQMEDQPKFEWMVSYLDFLGKVTGYGTTDDSTQDIRALAEGWARAFGEPVGVFQESDAVATSVYNAISRYASKTGASVVTVGLYSHPFGSVEAVRERLNATETRVMPYAGVPNVVIRVRPTESAAILANGVFEMAVQPESLYFDNNPVLASEGLGLPPSDVYRIRESKLVISSHPSQMPATLQFRFARAGSLGSFLDPSKFNPHCIDGSLVFRQSNALYAVSSILGNGQSHWVTLFADTVLPVRDRQPVFYEKLSNGENARIVPDMSWVKAVDQYFRWYPSVVVRASLVPEDHPLHAKAVGRGVLEMPAEERMLRDSVATMMPEAHHVETLPAGPLPTTWVEFRDRVVAGRVRYESLAPSPSRVNEGTDVRSSKVYQIFEEGN